MEEWKKIPGLRSKYGEYEVSSEGRAKNGLGNLMLLRPHYKGYRMIRVIKNFKSTNFQVHRAVALAFIPNPNNHPQVNHKNGIKSDNRVENLEWCTNYENHLHAKINGLLPIPKRGQDHAQAYLTNEEALEIRNAKLGNGITRAHLCKKYGVTIHVIKDIRNGKSYRI